MTLIACTPPATVARPTFAATGYPTALTRLPCASWSTKSWESYKGRLVTRERPISNVGCTTLKSVEAIDVNASTTRAGDGSASVGLCTTGIENVGRTGGCHAS